MAINRAQLAKELEPGLNALFGMEYSRYENEHAEIFDQETSDRAFEEEVMLMSYTKQVKAANILNNAFTTAGGDGVSLVNTAHPTALGGNFSNRSATDADLNETSLEQAMIDIAGFIDERGLKIAMQGRKLILPVNIQFVADRILNSTLRVGTADNDINALRNMGMLPDGYVINHYLNDTDAYFIKTDAPNGFKHFVRAPLTTGMEGDFDTGNMRYKARERYSFGFSDPRCVYGSQGS
jgi:hypothetical protein